MPMGTRKCKVCGCEYPYCKTNRPVGIFRYQDVACSPTCGSIYFARIAASRSKDAALDNTVKDSAATAESIDDSDEVDELFEEEFDDDAEELEIEL